MAWVAPAISVGFFLWLRRNFRLLVLIASAGMFASGLAADDSTGTAPKVDGQAVVEQCLRDAVPWETCQEVNKERVENPDALDGRSCVLGGGSIKYCFPKLSTHGLRTEPPGAAFYLRPRSLWTATPYDLLSDSGFASR